MTSECSNIGIVVKKNSNVAFTVAKKLIRELIDKGYDPILASENNIPIEKLGFNVRLLSLSDRELCKIIVVGGDGTLLRTAQLLGENDPEIMTIGAGRRCFYFDLDSHEGPNYLDSFLKGEYLLQYYPRMKVKVSSTGENWVFLNEVALVGDRGKLVRLEVMVSDTKLYEAFGDGIIIATTPGSTAYSLSAGGPVVEMLHNSIIVTPMNPIQLHIRPVVLNPFSLVKVYVRKDGTKPVLIVDGMRVSNISLGSTIVFHMAPKPLRIARFRWVRFYERTFERKGVF